MIERCPVCGRGHGAPPFEFASALPDRIAALPAAAREAAVIGDDNAALGDEAWYLRGRLAVPLVGGGCAVGYRAWCAVDRRSYKRALALWRDPRRTHEPPIAGRLAGALPGLVGSLGAAVRLEPRPPGEALAIRFAEPGPLADLQRAGIERDRAAALVAAALHG